MKIPSPKNRNSIPPAFHTPTRLPPIYFLFSGVSETVLRELNEETWERKKPINIKNFGGTPPGVRPVCPGDTSHLSRDMSRLSRGHAVPLVLIYACPRCPWNVPSLSLGRLQGIPTKFLYVIFLYRFFLSIERRCSGGILGAL